MRKKKRVTRIGRIRRMVTKTMSHLIYLKKVSKNIKAKLK